MPAVLVVLLVLCGSLAAVAGPRGSLVHFTREGRPQGHGVLGGLFTIKQRVNLEPVTAMEITGGKSRMSVSGGDFGHGRTGHDSLSLRRTVSRKVPDLWRLRLPVETRLYALDVSYELVGANGLPSRLCNLGKRDSEIKVHIDEIPPRVISREAHSTLIEGGMVMHLQLDTARAAGTYSGTLTVVVNHF